MRRSASCSSLARPAPPSLPIPPADANGNSGKLFITVPFYAREQIGTYVMHCHILAHEDGGMMAVVQGYDPASEEGAAQQK